MSLLRSTLFTKTVLGNAFAFGQRRLLVVPFSTSTPLTQAEIVLYQYTICPFCHQAKAFLDYYRTPYETIEVNPLTKAEIRQFREHNYKQVPIGVIKGDDPSMGNRRDGIGIKFCDLFFDRLQRVRRDGGCILRQGRSCKQHAA